MLPAVSQGSLGVQTRADDEETNALVSRLDHAATRAAVVAERALLRKLGGGCQVPIAAHAVVAGGELRLDGLVASLDGSRVIRDATTAATTESEKAGDVLAARMLERGAGELLSEMPSGVK